MTVSPTPLDTEALLQLRALLTHAKSASRSTSRITRMIAVILLDGVNERVTHLAATSLDVEITARTTFEDLFSKVKQELGTAWAARGWSDVRKLHRVRNIVQHENAGADNADIPAFREATERYTRDLVLSAFGVDLDTVMLAYCVEDAAIRQRVSQAEQASAAGDPVTAFTKTAEAFDLARTDWHQRHRLPPRRSFPRVTVSLNDPLESITRQIDALHKADTDRVFAADPAELAWFEQMRSVDPAHISLDEAERALSFVFWWIISWQAAVAFFVNADERRQQALQKVRKVRTGAGPARVNSVAASLTTDILEGGTTRIDYWQLRFKLYDVPEPADYNIWRQSLERILAANMPRSTRRSVVDGAGWVRVNMPASEDAEHVVQILHDSLQDAETALATQTAERQQRELDRQARDIQVAAAVEARRERLPSWFIGLRGDSPDALPRADIDDQAVRHILRVLTENDLNARPGPGQGVITIARAELEDVLDGIIAHAAAVEQAIAAEADDRKQRAAAATEFEADLARAIARLV